MSDATTRAQETSAYAKQMLANDRLILARLHAMLHELPRREREAVEAGMTYVHEYDALVAELEQARERIADLDDHALSHVAANEKLAADLERVTRERDEADEAHQHLAADHYFARAEKAESELAAAREDVTQLREAAKAVDANVKGPLVGRAWVAVSGNDFARLRAVLAGLSPVPPKDKR